MDPRPRLPLFGPAQFYRQALAVAGPVMLQQLVMNLASLVDNFMVAGLGDAKMGAINVANQGEQVMPGAHAAKTLRYYIHRHEMAAYYVISKLHLHGLQCRAAMENMLSGWAGVEIPYAIDAHQDMLHQEAMIDDL